MTLIALNGAKIKESTASGHINIKKYQQNGTGGGGTDANGNPIPTYPTYGWVSGYTTSAKINGTCTASETKVFIQGKNPVLKGDKTKETDTYELGSNEQYSSGKHTDSTNGSVTGGNSKEVYVGGKLIAIKDGTINTHASTSTTIGSEGLSSTVHIGG